MFLGSFLNFGIETCWTNSLLRFIKMFMKSRGWTLTRWARSYSDVMMLVDWCWSTKRIQACRVMLEKEWKHGKGTAVFWWEGYLFRGLAHSTVNSTRPFPYVDCIQTGFRMGPWVFKWPSVSMHRHAQEQEGARQQKHPSGLVGLGLGQLNAVDWCWLYYSYAMLYLDVFSLYMSLHVFTHLSAEAP